MRLSFGWVLILALLSHLLTGIFPYLAGETMGKVGKFPAMFIFYMVGSVLLGMVCIGSCSYRKKVKIGFQVLTRRNPPYRMWVVLISFSLAGFCYYNGLPFPTGPETPVFIYFCRLDWVLVGVVSAVIELIRTKNSESLKLTLAAIGAALLASCGGLLMTTASGLEAKQILWVIGFVIFSMIAYMLLKEERSQELTASVLLALRTVVMTVVFGLIAVTMDGDSMVNVGIEQTRIGCLAGVVLLLLFAFRLKAMKDDRMPLWLYSAFAPIQVAVLSLMLWYWGKTTLNAWTWTGVVLVTVGDVLASHLEKRRRKIE